MIPIADNIAAIIRHLTALGCRPDLSIDRDAVSTIWDVISVVLTEWDRPLHVAENNLEGDLATAILAHAAWPDRDTAEGLATRLARLNATLDLARVADRIQSYLRALPPIGDVPSTYVRDHWVSVWSEGRDQSVAGGRSGKWLVFRGDRAIDAAWQITRRCVMRGEIWSAKAKSCLLTIGRRPICIYTRDYEDKQDVGDCLALIRRVGLSPDTEILYYRPDYMTRMGISGSLYSSRDFEGPADC